VFGIIEEAVSLGIDTIDVKVVSTMDVDMNMEVLILTLILVLIPVPTAMLMVSLTLALAVPSAMAADLKLSNVWSPVNGGLMTKTIPAECREKNTQNISLH
jgi:signal transduction histidine kinase